MQQVKVQEAKTAQALTRRLNKSLEELSDDSHRVIDVKITGTRTRLIGLIIYDL